jgi:hypothetical protein
MMAVIMGLLDDFTPGAGGLPAHSGTCSSHVHDLKAGHDLELTDVAGDDSETELDSGGGDQKILEGDGHTPRSLVAFDAASRAGYLEGDRIDRHVEDQFIHKRLPPLPAFFPSGALDTVDELDFAVARFEMLEDLPNRAASPFPGDHHAESRISPT